MSSIRWISGRSATAVRQRLPLGREFVAADRLDHQRGARARLERLAERLDEPERVLAAEDAAVVEDEEEAEPLRHPQLRPAQPAPAARAATGSRIVCTGVDERGRGAPPRCARRRPRLRRRSRRTAATARGSAEISQNQSPTLSGGFRRSGAERGRDGGKHVGVDADQVEVVGVLLFVEARQSVAAISSGVVGASIVRHGDAAVLQRREDLPRRLADPALRAQVADQVDSRLGALLGRASAPRGGARRVRRTGLGGSSSDRDAGVRRPSRAASRRRPGRSRRSMFGKIRRKSARESQSAFA